MRFLAVLALGLLAVAAHAERMFEALRRACAIPIEREAETFDPDA